MMTKATRLTYVQILEISKFLEPIIDRTMFGVEYKGKWDDASVAKKFKVTSTNVSYLRTKAFGPLVKKMKSKPKSPTALPKKATARGNEATAAHADDMQARVAVLEARLAYLERELGVNTDNFTR